MLRLVLVGLLFLVSSCKVLSGNGVSPTSGRAESMLVFVGGYDSTGTESSDIYTSSGGVWTTTHLSLGCGYGALAVLSGVLFYTMPNCNDGFRYTFTSSNASSFTSSGSDADQLNFTSVTAFNGYLWRVGGRDLSNVIASVDRSSDGRTWTSVGSLPSAREGGGLLVFNSKLWYLGGANSFFTPTDLVYSSSDGVTWGTEAALPSPRSYMGATVFNNKMWLIGGYNSSNVLQSNVWSSDDGVSWNAVGTLPNALILGSLVTFNNKLWHAGGYTGSPLDAVYSSADGVSWTTETPLPTALYGGAFSTF